MVQRAATRSFSATARLLDQVGKQTVRENLEALARDAVGGYRDLLGWVATFDGDPAVRSAVRDELAAQGIGPARAHDALAQYLQAEIDGGRLTLGAPVRIVSAAFLGACHERAFLALFHDRLPFPGDLDTFARELVAALIR